MNVRGKNCLGQVYIYTGNIPMKHLADLNWVWQHPSLCPGAWCCHSQLAASSELAQESLYNPALCRLGIPRTLVFLLKPKVPGYCMRCRFCRKTQLLWESQSRHKSCQGCTFCIQSTFDLLQVSMPWVHREGNPPARQDQIPCHACCRVNCERSWTKENYCFGTYASFCWAQHPILMFLWLTKAHPPASGQDRISDQVCSWKTDGKASVPCEDSTLPALGLLKLHWTSQA